MPSQPNLNLKEAVALTRRLTDYLGATVTVATSFAAADLRRALGVIDVQAELLITTATLGTSLDEAFGLATDAGATFDTLDLARIKALNEAPTGALGVIIVDGFVQIALGAMALALADEVLTSRDQVDTYRARTNEAFDASSDDMAEAGDAEAYRALVSLHAAVHRDLTARARPLPRMAPYTFAERRPALWIANRLYGDGSRFEEIIKENRRGNPHPLFLRETGRALSR